MKPPYPYRALPTADFTIRLLRLPPGSNTETISCGIFHVKLSEAPAFEALSYCWGNPNDKGIIHIYDIKDPSKAHVNAKTELDKENQDVDYKAELAGSSSSSKRVPSETFPPSSEPRVYELRVPAALLLFLQRMRSHPSNRAPGRILWIDSICINQASDPEKSIQVQRMRDIYVKATRTLIWLGPENKTERSSQAMDYAFKIYHQRMKIDLDEDKEDAEFVGRMRERKKEGLGVIESARVLGLRARRWIQRSEMLNLVRGRAYVSLLNPHLTPLFHLLQREYFSRSWVIQEVAVSREPWVVCGNSSIPWLVFLSAYVWILEGYNWLFEFYGTRRVGLVFMMGLSARHVDLGLQYHWLRVLARHRSAEATDPRDKVWALWGLSARGSLEGLGEGVAPNYGFDVEEVYKRLVVKEVQRAKAEGKGGLEFLHVPRLIGEPRSMLPKQEIHIPSWCPDWRYTDRTSESLVRFEARNPDATPVYNATLTSESDVEFTRSDGSIVELENERHLGEIERLWISGYPVARITKQTPRPWTLQDPAPGLQTLRDQARVLKQNQDQVWEWEDSIFAPSRFFETYLPTGEARLDAMYKTLMTGLYPGGDVHLAKQIYLSFEGRQRWLRRLKRRGWDTLGVYLLVVMLGYVLRFFGIMNPEWRFRMLVSAMTNRRGAEVEGMDTADGVVAGAESGTRLVYMGLVPGIAEVGDGWFWRRE